MLKKASPKPHAQFMLMIDWDEMIRRMDVKQEPFPDPPDIRRQRYDRYVELSAQPGVTAIDGNSSVEEIHDKILCHLRATDAYSRITGA